jgi:PilZ domain
LTSQPLPEAGTLIELTTSPDAVPTGGVRVVQTDGDLLILSLAPADVPALGVPVTLRWAAGARGRYVRTGLVTETDENRIAVETTGDTVVEQHRNFVRGGGGEEVLLRRPGHPDVAGWIRDISEHGVRAHFADVEVDDGDEIVLRILLDPEIVQFEAEVTKTARLRQSIPRGGPMSVEVVAVFDTDEHQAQAIRRYVLRQQLISRGRTAS